MSGRPVIVADDVHKHYKSGEGVKGFHLEVPPGHVLGIIGPSGSGKTTIVRMMAGLLERDGGRLEVLETDPNRFDRAIRGRIGYLPQDTALYPSLSLEENLRFAASLHGVVGKDRRRAVRDALRSVDLLDARGRRMDESSGGMKRRLGLAAALLHDPEVLFLDEPTAGLDPILRKSLWERFRALRDDGRTLVITTQYMGEAAGCDSIGLLSRGQVVETGAPEVLRASAFGGELVDVTFSDTPPWSAIQQVKELTEARAIETLGPRLVRFIVEDAGTVLPRIASADDTGLAISEAERVVPEFEDVFVRIIERHTHEGAGA